MQVEPRQLCQLRPEIVDMELPDALALILNCRVVDGEQYRRLERKHGALVEWVKEVPN